MLIFVRRMQMIVKFVLRKVMLLYKSEKTTAWNFEKYLCPFIGRGIECKSIL